MVGPGTRVNGDNDGSKLLTFVPRAAHSHDQIGAELGVHWSTVSQQLHRAGVTTRRGAPAHPASTQQILELRDQA